MTPKDAVAILKDQIPLLKNDDWNEVAEALSLLISEVEKPEPLRVMPGDGPLELGEPDKFAPIGTRVVLPSPEEGAKRYEDIFVDVMAEVALHPEKSKNMNDKQLADFMRTEAMSRFLQSLVEDKVKP